MTETDTQHQERVASYVALFGWLDPQGRPVALCPLCGEVLPQRCLTVAGCLVVCRSCAGDAASRPPARRSREEAARVTDGYPHRHTAPDAS